MVFNWYSVGVNFYNVNYSNNNMKRKKKKKYKKGSIYFEREPSRKKKKAHAKWFARSIGAW